jgi:membrane protease subunit (stomatin/prohibitin family)
MNWDKAFKSPFKSDVYYFSTRLQTNQRWGTATPITIRDKEFGAVRMRGYGIYAYKIADPKLFYQKSQRHARYLWRSRSGRPVAQHHRRAHDR